MKEAKTISKSDKIAKGLKHSYQKMMEEKIRNNRKVAVSKDGRVKVMPAKKLQKK